jgi:hypothetical protein
MAHKLIVWKYTETSRGIMLLPYLKYGSEYFPVPRGEWDVWVTRWNPESTPKNERGVLSEDGTKLFY